MEYRLSIYVLVVIFNAAELVLLYQQRNRSILRRKAIIHNFNTLYIIASLCCADLSLGVSGTVLRTMTVLGRQYPKLAVQLGYRLSVISSVLHISLLTLDRGISIFAPLKHRLFMTKIRLRIILLVAWTVPITTSLLAVYLERTFAIHIFRVVMAATVVPTIIIALGAYAAMFLKVRQRQATIFPGSKQNHHRKHPEHQSHSQIAATLNSPESRGAQPFTITENSVLALSSVRRTDSSDLTEQQPMTVIKPHLEKENYDPRLSSFLVHGASIKGHRGAISKRISFRDVHFALTGERVTPNITCTCFESEKHEKSSKPLVMTTNSSVSSSVHQGDKLSLDHLSSISEHIVPKPTKNAIEIPFTKTISSTQANSRECLARDSISSQFDYTFREEEDPNSTFTKAKFCINTREQKILRPYHLDSSFESEFSEEKDSTAEKMKWYSKGAHIGGNNNQRSVKNESNQPNNAKCQRQETSSTSRGLQLSNKKGINREFRVLCFGLAIVICFGICLLPTTLLYLVLGKPTKLTMLYFQASFALTALNSLLNPFIYFLHFYVSCGDISRREYSHKPNITDKKYAKQIYSRKLY